MSRADRIIRTILPKMHSFQFVDPFEDADISGPSHPEVVYNWLELKEYFFSILFGKEHMMSRSASILHVLGSVTVF